MKIVIGNWKMNQDLAGIDSFFTEFLSHQFKNESHIGFAPQALHLPILRDKLKDTKIMFGAQNCSNQIKGAFTGETSVQSLKEMGCSFSLIGHSERRALYQETSSFLNEKVKTSLSEKLDVIFCCGETLEQRQVKEEKQVIKDQILEGLAQISATDFQNIIIAYEPVWAIGTGLSATADQAEEIHKFIKETVSENFNVEISQIVVIYGGSVKPANAQELFAMNNIDGALVGGASLKPGDFASICSA